MKTKTVLEPLALAIENKNSGTYTPSSLPFEIGKKYFIRTVTMYYTGHVKDVNGKFLILGDCAWIADTGRFNETIKDGSFSEIEPFPKDVIINSDCIVDAMEINFNLPLAVK